MTVKKYQYTSYAFPTSEKIYKIDNWTVTGLFIANRGTVLKFLVKFLKNHKIKLNYYNNCDQCRKRIHQYTSITKFVYLIDLSFYFLFSHFNKNLYP